MSASRWRRSATRRSCRRTPSRGPQEAGRRPRARCDRPDGVIVGWVLALRGRLQSLIVFGDPKVAAGYRGAFLLGATYSAAAIELQAAKKKVPMPGKDDPAKTLEIVTEGGRPSSSTG